MSHHTALLKIVIMRNRLADVSIQYSDEKAESVKRLVRSGSCVYAVHVGISAML